MKKEKKEKKKFKKPVVVTKSITDSVTSVYASWAYWGGYQQGFGGT